MQRVGFYLLSVFFLPLTLFSSSIKEDQIPRIMNRLFSYHVEQKSLNPTVVRRCIKIYIEHFDPDKTYLLESEVSAYLMMSDQEADLIGNRMKEGDYSDFYALGEVFSRAVERSRGYRSEVGAWVANSEDGNTYFEHPTSYAKSENELKSRLKAKAMRFVSYQQKKSLINTKERRLQAFELMNRKLQRVENPYMGLRSNGDELTNRKEEHIRSLRILKAFAKSLDAHTSFFSKEEAQDMRLSLEKQFEGYGVILSESIDGIIVSEVIPNSPAHKSGKVQENDLLVEIDGTSLQGLDFDTILYMMKKKGSSDIRLGVQRLYLDPKGNIQKDFWRVDLSKAPIVMDQERLSYTYEPYGNGIIAKITLKSFYENGNGINSERDIRLALQELRLHGPIKGLILDMRENSGGFLSQAVKVAGLFLSSGVVVISKYGKEDIHYLRSVDPKVHYSGPMLVLTSKLSASAAEIVAASLQDYGVALVVGDHRSYGKGTIQYQTVTDQKADLFFKVTVGKYYTVSGRTTQITGVIADIVIPTQFAPFNIGEKFLEYPLRSDKVEPAYQDRLSDVDERVKGWFMANYLPYLQQKVSIYRSMIPDLKKNSQARIRKNPDYQAFLKNQENIKARLEGDTSRPVDLNLNFGAEDLQMMEATNVLKDMIYLYGKTAKKPHMSFIEEKRNSLSDYRGLPQLKKAG